MTNSLTNDRIRKQLRDLPRTDKVDHKYTIDAYEDDLVYLISNTINEAKIDELETLLSNVPIPSLSYEQVQNRIASLR